MLLDTIKRYKVLLLANIFLLVILSATFYFLVTRVSNSNIAQVKNPNVNLEATQKPETSVTSNELTSWELPPSTKKGFPFVVCAASASLSIYSFETGKITDTKQYSKCGGGSSGYGSSDPLPSPDLLYTAYIDKQKGTLQLISNDTLEVLDTGIQGISYLSGWSPDSKRLVYSINVDNTISSGGGMAGPHEPGDAPAQFEKGVSPGFFVLDINTGANANLYPMSNFISFVGNNKILTAIDSDAKYLSLFNLTNFTAEFNIPDEYGFGVGQYNLSSDGTNWVFYYSKNPTADGNIMWANFPGKTGVTVDSGKWGDVQFPKLSPLADKLAYMRVVSVGKDGQVNNELYLYDKTSKTKRSLNIPVFQYWWVTNDQLIVQSPNSDPPVTTKDQYSLIDVSTDKKTLIFSK